jgi:hypothetical protein
MTQEVHLKILCCQQAGTAHGRKINDTNAVSPPMLHHGGRQPLTHYCMQVLYTYIQTLHYEHFKALKKIKKEVHNFIHIHPTKVQLTLKVELELRK